MQYFTFELDAENQKLCIKSTPLGLYKYKRLPMGIKQSSKIAQVVMENLFCGLNNVQIYIDDKVCFFINSYKTYSNLRHNTYQFRRKWIYCNPAKCEGAVKETDWLGYWLMPTGLKPWSNKINAIIAIQSPVNIKKCVYLLALSLIIVTCGLDICTY